MDRSVFHDQMKSRKFKFRACSRGSAPRTAPADMANILLEGGKLQRRRAVGVSQVVRDHLFQTRVLLCKLTILLNQLVMFLHTIQTMQHSVLCGYSTEWSKHGPFLVTSSPQLIHKHFVHKKISIILFTTDEIFYKIKRTYSWVYSGHTWGCICTEEYAVSLSETFYFNDVLQNWNRGCRVEKAGPNIVDLLYLAGPFDGSIVVAAISQWRRCLSACVRAPLTVDI